MSLASVDSAHRPAPALPRPLRDTLHAEWTKLRTAPGTGWLLLAAVALTVAVSAAAAAGDLPGRRAAARIPPRSASPGSTSARRSSPILAVLAISGEYSTGMIRITLAAMPRRTTVLAAKAAVVTGLTLAAGTVAVLGVAAGRAAHPARPRLHRGARLRAAVPGRRAGAARRRRLGALPGPDRAAQPRRRHRRAGLRGRHRARARPALPVPDRRRRGLRPDWQRHLQQIAPMTAGLDIQATTGLRSLPLSPWPASASSPPGPPRRSWPAAWCCACGTPELTLARRRRRTCRARTRPPRAGCARVHRTPRTVRIGVTERGRPDRGCSRRAPRQPGIPPNPISLPSGSM